MKSIKILLSLAIVALLFTSCQPDAELKTTIVNFEGVTLKDSVWNGSDSSGIKAGNSYNSEIQLSSILFGNTFTPSAWGGSWKGFAFSSKKDTKTIGWDNQYSVIAGGGALSSKQFALAFDSATISCPINTDGGYSIKSMWLTNSTYTFLDMKNGSLFSKKFGEGDWYKVIITGYLNGVKTSTVDYYLADFRAGKTFLSNTWNKVDVSALGKVDEVTFTFDSSDKGAFGMNTPAYACIDNIEFTQTISTK